VIRQIVGCGFFFKVINMRKHFKKTMLASLVVSALGGLVAMPNAYAGEAEILKKIEALEAEIKALKADAMAAKKAPAAPVASAAPEAAAYTKVNKGYLSWGSADGNYELTLDGRVQLDVGSVSSENNPKLRADTNFRRIRLGLKGTFYKDWQGEFDLDFASSEVTIRDMWVQYSGIPNVNIKAGNFKPHFSMDQVTSSRVYTHMESSIATDYIAPSRRIGLAADFTNPYFFVGGGVFGDKPNVAGEPTFRDDPSLSEQSELFGHSLRAVVRPLWQGQSNKAFHLGFNYLNQKPRSQANIEERWVNVTNGANVVPTLQRRYTNKNNSLKFGTLAETELMGADTDALDTRLYGATDARTMGLELAFKYGRHQLSSEYLRTTVLSSPGDFYNRDIPDANFKSYYVAYSFWLSGDREYEENSAEFGKVSGKNAIELVARYSMLDLNDASGGTETSVTSTNFTLPWPPATKRTPVIGASGGKGTIWTAGVNWYPNTNLMFRLQYQDIRLDEKAAWGADNVKVLGLRTQFTF
jgi:phosphate-selective porin OprO/OprP